jgi:hypothetical protein
MESWVASPGSLKCRREIMTKRVRARVTPWRDKEGDTSSPPHHFVVEALDPLADPGAHRRIPILDLPQHGHRYIVEEVAHYQRNGQLSELDSVEVVIDARYFSTPLDEWHERWEMVWSALVEANKSILGG